MSKQALTAAQMRHAFDEAFSRPITVAATDNVELLAIQAGDRRMALVISDITGIHLCPAVTEVPSDGPALMGVGNVRAALAGIYSLSALMGGSRRNGQWIVTCGDGTVALAFDELCGYARAAPGEIARSREAGGEAAFVEVEGKAHALVDITKLLKAITGRG